MARKLKNNKPMSVSLPGDLILRIDTTVEKSALQFKDRSHFVQLAIMEKLDRVKEEEK